MKLRLLVRMLPVATNADAVRNVVVVLVLVVMKDPSSINKPELERFCSRRPMSRSQTRYYRKLVYMVFVMFFGMEASNKQNCTFTRSNVVCVFVFIYSTVCSCSRSCSIECRMQNAMPEHASKKIRDTIGVNRIQLISYAVVCIVFLSLYFCE